jgi:hypothetical protein
MIAGLGWAALALALVPAVIAAANLRLYRRPAVAADAEIAVSVLIPARDEETEVAGAVRAALAALEGASPESEVLVLDDHSTDRTAAIVRDVARQYSRVRLLPAPELPSGWVGKPHACHVLAGAARHSVLLFQDLFQDADVRLAPRAAARIASFLLAGNCGLVSGIPRQQTDSFGERLVVPLIHFVLLGFLPIARMRRHAGVGLGAACGQLIAVRRDAYLRAGGHAAIRTSLHDGLTLPRAFRRAGQMTDLFDATGLACCRMYRGWRQVRQGFARNAHEGMATPRGLPIWTLLLGSGQVLPWLLLAAAALLRLPLAAWAPAPAAAMLGLAMRAALAIRFRQSGVGVVLHPFGILCLLAIQWSSLWRSRRGAPARWRGRQYLVSSGSKSRRPGSSVPNRDTDRRSRPLEIP